MKQLSDSSNIKKKRERARLSQWRVARALGKSQGWLSNIERGYVSPPKKVLTDILRTIESLNRNRN